MTIYRSGNAVVHRDTSAPLERAPAAATGSGWTEARVAKLRELWPTKSASQIAKQLGGVTRNAVIGKAHRLGLPAKAARDRWDGPRHPRDRIRRPGKGVSP